MMNATASRISERRTAARLSQRHLEAKTGISQSTLNRIERGVREPKMDELLSIAWALGTTYGDLIDDSDVRNRLRFAGRAGSADAFAAMKEQVTLFFELDDSLDEFAVARHR